MKIIKNWLLKHLLCAVTEQDVLSILQDRLGKTIRLYLGKEQITDGEYLTLLEEAKFLEKTRLWSILTNSLAEQAKLRMFEQAKTSEDLYFGKAMLYCIDTQKKLIDRIKTYKQADAN